MTFINYIIRPLFLLFLALWLVSPAFSQEINPYELFGYTAEVQYKESLKAKEHQSVPLLSIGAFARSRKSCLIGNDSATSAIGQYLRPELLFRFMQVDPLFASYPHNSPYAFSENSVIRYVELEGLEKASPEEFTRALDQIKTYQGEAKISNETVFQQVNMTDVLATLEDQISYVVKNGHTNAKSNYMGYYCGKAAAQNNIIMYNPVGYVSFMHDLFKKGSAKLGGGRTVRTDKMSDKSGSWSSNSVDAVFALAVDASAPKKKIMRGVLGWFTNELERPGNTIPFEMNKLLTTTGMKAKHSSSLGEYGVADLLRMQEAIAQNYIPIVFENHGITRGVPDAGNSGKFGIHYTPIYSLNVEGDQVSYEFWEYGRKASRTTSVKAFTSAMKGYWIPENR